MRIERAEQCGRIRPRPVGHYSMASKLAHGTQPLRLVHPKSLRLTGHGPLRKGKLPAHHSARCHCGLTAISTYTSRAVVVRGPGSDRKRFSKREARLPPVSNYFSRPFARILAGKLRGMLGKTGLRSHRCFTCHSRFFTPIPASPRHCLHVIPASSRQSRLAGISQRSRTYPLSQSRKK